MNPETITRDRILPLDLPVGLLHVVVYGPGAGEAVVVRLPDGEWGVVDGCGASGHGGNPVADLLEAASVERLLFAALTHPHADHLWGLDEVIDRFHPRHLWWAGETHPRFFQRYVKALRRERSDAEHEQAHASEPPPAAVIDRVARSLFQSRRGATRGACAVGTALSDEKVLLRRADPGAGPPVLVRGILPTTRSVQLSIPRIVRRREPRVEDVPADVEPDGDVNELSGALFLSWGEARALLAGDALVGPRKGEARGWAWCRARCLEAPVQVVKVAHHASRGAHDDDLWAHMRPSLALVTPYRQGSGTMPPQPEMLRTLLDSGASVGLTSRPAWWESRAHGLAGFHVSPPPLQGLPGGSRARSSRPSGDHPGAIAASLDASGNIVRIVLAGGAALLRRG